FLIEELLDIVDDVVDPLGVREEIEYIRVMLERGSSADRQLRTYDETGDLKAVVDQLAEETVTGL
ncbi:MAG: carboxylate-amine ligase, partial [candidate division Zixibacteria bacterium]|nr:carboxylate-amine ligase [candidate division Zixibacteria bacterium]